MGNLVISRSLRESGNARTFRLVGWTYWLGAAVDALAAAALLTPAGSPLRQIAYPGVDGSEVAFADGTRTVFGLMAGWTVLLAWGARRPIERRVILLITAVPVIAGFLVTEAMDLAGGYATWPATLPTVAIQVTLMVVLVASFLAAERLAREPAQVPARARARFDLPEPEDPEARSTATSSWAGAWARRLARRDDEPRGERPTMIVESRAIASVLGPTLLAVNVSETMNLGIWATNTPTVTYLNGLLFFVAGLVVVRLHNRWSRNWTVAVTLSGWALIVAGLWRMLFPTAPQGGENLPTYGLIAALFAIGAFLTYQAYRPHGQHDRE